MKEFSGQNTPQRVRKKIAHAELWAWAEETLVRRRLHSVGVIGTEGVKRGDLDRSLREFSKALKSQDWCVIECAETQNETQRLVGVEHQLSSLLLELEASSHIPKHVELTAHHKSELPLDGLTADAKMNSLRRESLRESTPPGQEDRIWDNLELNLPDEWSEVETPPLTDMTEEVVSQEFTQKEVEMGMPNSLDFEYEIDDHIELEDDQIKVLSSQEVILKAFGQICQSMPILLVINRRALTENDEQFLIDFVESLHSKRSLYSLLLLWAYPLRELDDSVQIGTEYSEGPSEETRPKYSNRGLDQQETQDIGSEDLTLRLINPSEGESTDELNQLFDQVFEETFSIHPLRTVAIEPIDNVIDRSIDLMSFEGDPHELMKISSTLALDVSFVEIVTDQATTDQATTDQTTTDQATTDQTTTDQTTTDQATTDQATTDQATTDQAKTDQTTTELPKLSLDSPLDPLFIERGDFTECQRIAINRYGATAPALLVFAASGPTATIGQMSTLWRSVVEHPLQELRLITESMWEGLSNALESGAVISTSHQRFISEQSFRFRDSSVAVRWRDRWGELVSSRLRRRAHGTLAQWMQNQSISPIAQPQVTLTVLEHWVEAGATNEAGVAGLNAAKLLMERGDSARAKRALQRVVQLLGPEGNWPIWRESLELLLKLNLEAGDNIAIEFVSKQLIDRAWRIGEVSLVRRLSLILENLYKTTGRRDEALHLGEWSMSQPLVDQTAELFDKPMTMFPALGSIAKTFSERTEKYPTLLADLPPPEDLYLSPTSDELMSIPEIHTLEAPPSFLLQALSTLRQHNFEAFIVGGSVRDRLLGREVNDWDLTTNAHPHEVSACFDKVIETGIQHGTVTVILDEEHIEITTYRIDGEYGDGRRPNDVQFTRSLNEDLLRRDFTVNAIAWDPINASLEDPYNGVADLQKSILRAVGDPQARFREDGLRVLRAIRFSTVLDFSIEEATQRGAIEAIDVLGKVAVERVQVELFKTLQSPYSGRGLSLIKTFGVTEICFPELPSITDRIWSHLERAIEHCEVNIETRLALVFYAVFQDQKCSKLELATLVKKTLKRLKVSNKLSQQVLHLVSLSGLDPSRARTDVQARTLAVEIGTEHLDSLMSYQEAWLIESDDSTDRETVEAWRALRVRFHELKVDELPHTPKDLEINGKDLCDALDLFPSRAIGELLNDLLRWVWESPVRNQHDQLIERAREIASERGLIQ